MVRSHCFDQFHPTPPRSAATHLELPIIELQILSHTRRLGISNIGAVEESHKI